jgi:hypothetical protein
MHRFCLRVEISLWVRCGSRAMYELVGIGYALRQLGLVVKELLGLHAADRRLDAGIKELQRKYTRLTKVVDQQGLDAVAMRAEIDDLTSQAHGLKSMLGKERKKDPNRKPPKGPNKKPPKDPNKNPPKHTQH